MPQLLGLLPPSMGDQNEVAGLSLAWHGMLQ